MRWRRAAVYGVLDRPGRKEAQFALIFDHHSNIELYRWQERGAGIPRPSSSPGEAPTNISHVWPTTLTVLA